MKRVLPHCGAVLSRTPIKSLATVSQHATVEEKRARCQPVLWDCCAWPRTDLEPARGRGGEVGPL